MFNQTTQTTSTTSLKIECQICTYIKDCEVMCENNHIYCLDCLNEIFLRQLDEDKKLNKNCLFCHQPFFEQKLDAFISVEIKSRILKDNFLDLFEIPSFLTAEVCSLCPKENQALFLIDRKDLIQDYTCEMCNLTSCLFCKKAYTNKNDHIKCKELIHICYDLEKVISIVFKFKCNICFKSKNPLKYETLNEKDDACTHMKCNKCNSYNCYVCGGHDTIVDKSFGTKVPISRHNDDWKTNPKRCPMYLSHFSEVITGWKNDEHLALQKFNEYRLSYYTKCLANKYGMNKVIEAYKHFTKENGRLEDTLGSYIKDDFNLNFPQYSLIEAKLTKL